MSTVPTPPQVSWLRTLWAGVLSLVFPGLGQIYAGYWWLGIRLYAIVGLASAVLLVALTRLSSPMAAAMIAFIALGILIGIAQIVIAVDAARRIRRGYGLRSRPWYQSSWLAVVIMLVLNILIPMGRSWQSFYAASDSNLPTLIRDDVVMADTRNAGSAPAAGDVIIFFPARQPTVHWIKRVVGLPGDRVQLRRGVLFVNGQEARREPAGEYRLFNGRIARQYIETLPNGRRYSILQQTDDGRTNNTAEYVVPPGKLFVLGDNRDDSLDSRDPQMLGDASIASVVGTVGTIYWSSDLSRILTPVN
jgi:signal peptidase I